MKAVVISTIENDIQKMVQVKDVERSLESYYKEIGCDIIDVTSRKIAGEWYDIICDDEGLLKSDPVISAVDQKGHPALVGGLIICRYDGEGDFTDLTDDDVERIQNNIGVSFQSFEFRPVVVLDE